MGLSKTATLILDNVAINASASVYSSIVDLSDVIDFGIGFTVNFGSGTTGNVKIEVFADPTGSNPSYAVDVADIPYDGVEIPYSAGNVVSGYIPVIRGPKYIRLKVTNLSATVAIPSMSIWAIPQKA